MATWTKNGHSSFRAIHPYVRIEKRNNVPFPLFGGRPFQLMIYLMEEAAAQAIQEYLPEGWVSVGAMINVKHLAATPVGFKVTARAEVLSINENLVTFAVEAHDGIDKIGEGTQVRAVIETKQFEKRVRLKARRVRDSL